MDFYLEKKAFHFPIVAKFQVIWSVSLQLGKKKTTPTNPTFQRE